MSLTHFRIDQSNSMWYCTCSRSHVCGKTPSLNGHLEARGACCTTQCPSIFGLNFMFLLLRNHCVLAGGQTVFVADSGPFLVPLFFFWLTRTLVMETWGDVPGFQVLMRRNAYHLSTLAEQCNDCDLRVEWHLRPSKIVVVGRCPT